MEVSSARKATGMVVTAVAILALAVGSAFAGTDFSSGGGATHGNKTGNGNKTPGACGTDFTLVDAGVALAYDLNQDGLICQKDTGSGFDYTDNSVKT